MRKILTVFCFCLSAIIVTAAAASASPFASLNLGGQTGLISTPNAQIGWDTNKIGIDGGFHYIKPDTGDSTNVYKVNVSLFQKAEIGAMYDDQSDGLGGKDPEDLILNGKFRFYPWEGTGKSALAIGGRYEKMNYNSDNDSYKKYQLYLAATYGGEFFGLPAETTMVIGKTWGDKRNNDDDDNIDFSMGFDLDMFPSVFKGYVHWISDFGNYSYSYEAKGADAWNRGAFNTGARIAILKDANRFKLNLDALLLDALDKNRSWAVGLTFGAAI